MSHATELNAIVSIAKQAIASGKGNDLRQAKQTIVGTVETIRMEAESDGRELTDDELRVVDALLGKGNDRGLSGEVMDALQKAEDKENALSKAAVAKFAARGGFEGEGHRMGRQGELRSSTGKKVLMLSNQERLTDHYQASDKLASVDCAFPMGELATMMVCGKNRNTPSVVAALSGNSNSGGGYLVPDTLLPGVIDKARAAAVVFRAGAMTMVMDSSTVMMASVDSDPEFSVVGENATIPESSVTFGQRQLNAYKIGCIVKASRELVEDAPNFAQMFEGVLARSLAVELDRLTLVGSGSQEPVGLLNNPNTPNDAITGTLDWIDVGNSATEIRKVNYEPNAVLMSPTNHGHLMHQQAGNGVDSSATWLLAPPSLATQNLYSTSNMPEDKIAVGQFNMLAWGIRQGALIEVSTAGDAFDKHQVHFKITFRGDWIPMDFNAFHVATGVTL